MNLSNIKGYCNLIVVQTYKEVIDSDLSSLGLPVIGALGIGGWFLGGQIAGIKERKRAEKNVVIMDYVNRHPEQFPELSEFFNFSEYFLFQNYVWCNLKHCYQTKFSKYSWKIYIKVIFQENFFLSANTD